MVVGVWLALVVVVSLSCWCGALVVGAPMLGSRITSGDRGASPVCFRSFWARGSRSLVGAWAGVWVGLGVVVWLVLEELAWEVG